MATRNMQSSARGRSHGGMLTKVYTENPDNAESKEEREVIRLFNASPDVRAFVTDWILYCYHSYEASSEATQPRRKGRAASRKS